MTPSYWREIALVCFFEACKVPAPHNEQGILLRLFFEAFFVVFTGSLWYKKSEVSKFKPSPVVSVPPNLP